MIIEFLGKENDWQNKTTHYWCAVTCEVMGLEAEQFAIVDSNGDLSFIGDSEKPIDNHQQSVIFNRMIPFYQENYHE